VPVIESVRSVAVAGLGGQRRVDEIKRLPRRATSSRRSLPDFVVIGAMKSGTTTLYNHIVGHPAVRPAFTREVHFFDDNYSRGVSWYRANFPLDRGAHGTERSWVTGEASPYYLLHPLAPARAADVVPAARLIAVLRHPVDRAYSHYQHERAKGTESLSFADALAAEPERIREAWDQLAAGVVDEAPSLKHYSYLTRSRYDEQLERWLAHFPPEQLLVLKAEDLYQQPGATMARVFAHLGLPVHPGVTELRSNSREYDGLAPTIRATLATQLRGSVARLSALLGRDFGWDL
jgi:hypothetical protein